MIGKAARTPSRQAVHAWPSGGRQGARRRPARQRRMQPTPALPTDTSRIYHQRTPASPITVSRPAGNITVCVAGEIDLLAGPGIVDQVRTVLAETPRLVIDLAAVTFCDSTGISALLQAKRLPDAAGIPMATIRVAPRLLRVFTLTGVADALNATPTP